MSGGELQRAILDKNCVFSAPCFYTIQIPQINDASAAFRNMPARLQCKSDRWFLQTGIMAYSVTNAPVYQDVGNQRLISIFDASNLHQFFDNPLVMQSIECGRNVTDYMTFPEYILWRPNSVIGVTLNGQSTNAGFLNYIVLGGIEYAR